MWPILGTIVASAVAVDVGILHHDAKPIMVKRAVLEIAAWISLALAFNLWV